MNDLENGCDRNRAPHTKSQETKLRKEEVNECVKVESILGGTYMNRHDDTHAGRRHERSRKGIPSK